MNQPATAADARHAISNALTAYCAAVDAQNSLLVGALLSEARLTFRGREIAGHEIVDFYADAFASSGDTSTTHTFANLSIDPGAVSEGAHSGVVTYRAVYQRWTLSHEGPRCEALGTYQGTFAQVGTSPLMSSPSESAAWRWTSHRVDTLSAL